LVEDPGGIQAACADTTINQDDEVEDSENEEENSIQPSQSSPGWSWNGAASPCRATPCRYDRWAPKKRPRAAGHWDGALFWLKQAKDAI